MARPPTGGEGVADVSIPAVGRPPCPVRHLQVQDPDVRPGAPSPWRLLPGRCRAPRLDGPVRGDARDPDPAACLVPRQRTVDVHVSMARAACPSCRRPAPGLAWRHRDRTARRVGESRHRQWRGLRPDARRDRERTAGPDRTVPRRLGGHRAAHRRSDRAVGDGRHRGALSRATAGLAGPAGHLGARPRGSARWRGASRRGLPRGARPGQPDERCARRHPRAGRRGAPPVDRRSARRIRVGCDDG